MRILKVSDIRNAIVDKTRNIINFTTLESWIVFSVSGILKIVTEKLYLPAEEVLSVRRHCRGKTWIFFAHTDIVDGGSCCAVRRLPR